MLSGTRSTHPPINWGPSLEREGGRKTTRDVLQALSQEAQSNPGLFHASTLETDGGCKGGCYYPLSTST